MKKDNKKKGGFMKIPREMAYSPDYTSTEIKLYAVLDDRYDYRQKMDLLNDGYMTVNITELAMTLKVSRPTITTALQKLVTDGLIVKREDKKNAPNEYKILNYDAVNEIIAKKAGKEAESPHHEENPHCVNKKANKNQEMVWSSVYKKMIPKSPMSDAYNSMIYNINYDNDKNDSE